MKPSSLALVPLLVAGVAACSRAPEPARGASAQPTPSPIAASAPPIAAAPGDTLPAAPPEAAPSTDRNALPAASTDAQGRIDPATGVRIETAPTPGPRTRSTRSGSKGTVTSRPVPPPEARDTRLPSAPPEPQQRSDAGRPADEVQTTVRRAQEPLVLPEGTELPIRLGQTLASDRSRPEQDVTAEITDDVRSADGRVALPAGTEILGHVVVAQQSGRVQGRARLVVAFDEIRLRNRSYPIQAWRWDVTAESSRDRDAKIAGGAAAAGAIIGAITGGGKGALKGGILGGAAGGAAVLVTRGKEVELRSGAQHKITLRQALRIE